MEKPPLRNLRHGDWRGAPTPPMLPPAPPVSHSKPLPGRNDCGVNFAGLTSLRPDGASDFLPGQREIAGERIRDKIAASKAKGMWMGGNVPLGYYVKDRKLIVNEEEAETIRMIFRKYVELGSIRLLKYDLDENGIVSKRREGSGVVRAGGSKFSRGALYNSLRNPIYHGEIGHKGKVYPGQHEAIVDPILWRLVQDKLAGNRHAEKIAATAEAPNLLAGLIEDGDGHHLTSTHAVKTGRRYRYYVSKSRTSVDRPRHANHSWRIPAGAIEELLLDRLRDFFASGQEIRDALSCLEHNDIQTRSACSTALGLADGWAALASIEIRELVRATIEKVVVRDEEVIVSLKRAAVATRLLGGNKASSEIHPGTIELRIEAKLRRAGKGVRLVVGVVSKSRTDRSLLCYGPRTQPEMHF